MEIWKANIDGVESSGEPKFSKETCEEFFKSKYVDANRDYEYEPPFGLEHPPLPHWQVLFDLEKPTFNDLNCEKEKKFILPWHKWELLFCLQIKQKNSIFTVGITLLYLGKV